MMSRLSVKAKSLALAAAGAATLSLALGSVAGGQGMPVAGHDYKATTAGKYVIDAKHTGLIARVPHVGFSYSIFRFQTVSGTLDWNPANPAADHLDVTVDPKSIVTAPVEGFSDEIGAKFLNVAKFPTATFVSTAFHPTSATHGTVDGDLTLMGVTKHVTFDVALVGTGAFHGTSVIGVTARTDLDPKTYGLPGFITGPIQLVIDTEFHGAS